MSLSMTLTPSQTRAPRPQVAAPPPEEFDMRQLRHHTKNTLQRIMGLITQAPYLAETPEGQRFAHELEQRIHLSAAISDAMFGLTRDPGPLDERLSGLGHALIELLRDPGQRIGLNVFVGGECPVRLREPILRIVNELVCNAVKHGLRGRARGRISIEVDCHQVGVTRLAVLDDGCGISRRGGEGQGLSFVRSIAEDYDGTFRLTKGCGTVAIVELLNLGLDS